MDIESVPDASVEMNLDEFLKKKINFEGDVEKGCGTLCDENPSIFCIGCKKFKWHKKCFTTNYPDFDFNSNWENATKKHIIKFPECETWRNVPKYPRILK